MNSPGTPAKDSIWGVLLCAPADIQLCFGSRNGQKITTSALRVESNLRSWASTVFTRRSTTMNAKFLPDSAITQSSRKVWTRDTWSLAQEMKAGANVDLLDLKSRTWKENVFRIPESWDRNSIILFHVHVHSLDDVCHFSYHREVKACIFSTMGSWPMPTCGTTWVLTPRPLRRRWRRQSAVNQGIYGIYIIYAYILYMCNIYIYIYCA